MKRKTPKRDGTQYAFRPVFFFNDSCTKKRLKFAWIFLIYFMDIYGGL